MRTNYKFGLIVLALLSFPILIYSQNKFFSDAGENRTVNAAGQRVIIPQHFRTAALDVQAMKNFLWSLPSGDETSLKREEMPVLTLPMPDGSYAKFRVWESSIMEPGLAVKFPEMRTFAGQGIDDPSASVRLDYNPYFGFSAQVLSPVNGRVLIDPYSRGDINNYISYRAADFIATEDFICNFPESANRIETITAGPCRGTQLSTYRLALACTGEYAVAVAGATPSVSAVAAAMLTAMNRVNGIYEIEFAIHMNLIANNDLLIYLDGTTDPYTNNSGSTMLSENITNVNSVIGSANYDIGHVFSTGGGGVAFLGVVCGSSKAGGVTGLSNPVGDPFYVDYVSHEMGHQFGATHTFNSSLSNCGGGNRSAGTAYEVGSGSTIMAYSGICGADNLQTFSDPNFHSASFDQISSYITTGTGSACAVNSPTGNILPVITSMNNNGANIPLNTPFTLSGTATDANGDLLTYSWEEWDLGPTTTWNGGNANGNSPLFKSRKPKLTGERTFPDIAVILAGYPANPPPTTDGLKGETLPTVARALKFRLTVRDNRAGGGGVVTGGDGCGTFPSIFQINTIDGTGPFLVTVPNGGESYSAGSSQTITWNTAGTEAAPISTANVKISLSTDGGLTYPTVLAANTPNDGSETITFPGIASTSCRVKVEAVGNIFFDISNANFTLVAPPAGFDFSNPSPAVSSCPAPSSMSVTLGTVSNGGFTNPITLSATGNPAGTSVSFSVNPVTPGNSTVVTLNGTNNLSAGSYIINVQGVASGAINKNVNLTYTINSGTGPVILSQPSSQTVCEGTNASFTVTATGSYQWQVSTNGGSSWLDINGATSASYTIISVSTSLNGNQYRCVVSSQCGSTSSNAATLTVTPVPVVTTNPVNKTICSGSDASFSVAATGAGLSYQWQVNTGSGFANISNGGVYSGATTLILTISGAPITMNNYLYRCVVSGTCAPPANSASAVLTVIAPVTLTSSPSPSVICSGSNTTFTVAGSSTVTILYQWQENTGSGFTNISNTGVYSGATTSTLSVTGASTSLDGNQYRCLLSNATCTVPTISGSATLTVRQLPTVSLAAVPITNLLPGQTTTLTATPSAATIGTLSTNWLYNNNPVTNSGNTRLVNVEQTGTYQVTIQEVFTNPSIVCANQSQVVTITAGVSDKLFIFPSPNDGNFIVSYYNNGGSSTQRSIVIFDSKGAQVYNKLFSITGPYTLIPVNMQGGSRGIYYVVVSDNNGNKLIDGKVHIR